MKNKYNQEITVLTKAEKESSKQNKILISREVNHTDIMDTLKYLRNKCMNNGHLSEFTKEENEILTYMLMWMDPTTLKSGLHCL